MFSGLPENGTESTKESAEGQHSGSTSKRDNAHGNSLLEHERECRKGVTERKKKPRAKVRRIGQVVCRPGGRDTNRHWTPCATATSIITEEQALDFIGPIRRPRPLCCVLVGTSSDTHRRVRLSVRRPL